MPRPQQSKKSSRGPNSTIGASRTTCQITCDGTHGVMVKVAVCSTAHCLGQFAWGRP